VRPTDATHYLVKLLNLDMPVPLDISTNTGTARMMVDKKGIVVTSTALPMIDTRDFYLKKVIFDL
jgi:hypothetical protein